VDDIKVRGLKTASSCQDVSGLIQTVCRNKERAFKHHLVVDPDRALQYLWHVVKWPEQTRSSMRAGSAKIPEVSIRYRYYTGISKVSIPYRFLPLKIIFLFYYFIILLFYYFIILLFYYFIILLFYYFIILLFYLYKNISIYNSFNF